MTPMDRKLLGVTFFIGVPTLLILLLTVVDFSDQPRSVLESVDLVRDLIILVMVGGWLMYVLTQVIIQLAAGNCNLKQKLVVAAAAVLVIARWAFFPARGNPHGGLENEFADWARALFHTVGIILVSSLFYYLLSSRARHWLKRHRS